MTASAAALVGFGLCMAIVAMARRRKGLEGGGIGKKAFESTTDFHKVRVCLDGLLVAAPWSGCSF